MKHFISLHTHTHTHTHTRSEEHRSELQSHLNLVCRLLLEKQDSVTRLHGLLLIADYRCIFFFAILAWSQLCSRRRVVLCSQTFICVFFLLFFFFLNNRAPTEISTLPLHDALPI